MEIIVYVDDEQANLIVFEALCESIAKIVTFSDPQAAIDYAASNEVAVFLSDQRMPGKNGTQVLQEVTASSPNTIRMLVTAYADLDEAIAAINKGHIRRYVRKPWNADELLATLQESLEQYTLSKKQEQMQRRLMETERVANMGLLATGIVSELGRPLHELSESVVSARRLLSALSGSSSKLDEAISRLRNAERKCLGAKEALAGLAKLRLDSTRPSAGRSADPEEIVALSLRSMRSVLRERANVDFKMEPVPRVAVSPEQLAQVILTLLSSAVDHLIKGDPRNRITLHLYTENDQVLLEIEHNGETPSSLTLHLADPIQALTEVGESAMSLSIVDRLVANLGGNFSANIDPGGDTTFLVALPSLRPLQSVKDDNSEDSLPSNV